MTTIRRVPTPTLSEASAPDRAAAAIVREIAARLNPVALGASLAIVSGVTLLLAPDFLVLKGGPQVGVHLGLLSQYLPGYRVTLAGGLIGGLYAAAIGFLLGWTTAALRNMLLNVYLRLTKFRANLFDTSFLDRLD